MSKRLKILWDGDPGLVVGHLHSVLEGLEFEYHPDWMKKGYPISRSLSFEENGQAQFHNKANIFFSHLNWQSPSIHGILEEDKADESYNYKFLKHFGAECAGALVIVPDSPAPPPSRDDYREIGPGLPDMLRKRREERQPLIRILRDQGKPINFSLAGAQDKIAVLWENDKLYVPQKGTISPTNWILKPSHLNPLCPFVPENEYLCNRLAQSLGLPVPESRLLRIGDEAVLMIKRYDRITAQDGSIKRLHQEDFCQALSYDLKKLYEFDGGPGFRDCGRMFLDTAGQQQRKALLQSAIFNTLIGNNDAHGKNFSLLYAQAGQPTLAPFYDLLFNVTYQDDNRMAMKIGDSYMYADIRAESFMVMGQDLDIHNPLLVKTLQKMTSEMPAKLSEFLPEIEQFSPDARLLLRDFPVMVKNRCQKLETMIPALEDMIYKPKPTPRPDPSPDPTSSPNPTFTPKLEL